MAIEELLKRASQSARRATPFSDSPLGAAFGRTLRVVTFVIYWTMTPVAYLSLVFTFGSMLPGGPSEVAVLDSDENVEAYPK